MCDTSSLRPTPAGTSFPKRAPAWAGHLSLSCSSHGGFVAAGGAGEAREPESVYLGRQPILDRAGALHAYELLFRDSPENHARIHDDVQATAHVVARTVGEIGLSAVLGDYRGYVNMNRALLFDDIVHIMPPERFVLELLETITFDAALFRRCTQLREAGFQFALDDVVPSTTRS